MTFTYSASALSTTALFQIRREIGDTSESGSLFDDAELTYFYAQESNNTRLAAARALVGAQQLSQQQGRIAYLDDAVLTEQGLSDDELDQRIAYARWALALAGKDARGDHDVPSDAYYSSGSIEERARLVAQRHPSVTVLIKPGPWADALEAAGVRVTRLA